MMATGMDQIIDKVLRFDRFTLDLGRASLRDGQQDIELRPKSFDVLRCLVENGGRLVSKQKLLEAAWPGIAVTDDSLVQCIRELRAKLGDDDHRLIKTVSRRGYMLDATVTNVTFDQAVIVPPDTPVPAATRARRLSGWIVTGLAVCVVLTAGYFYFGRPSAPAANILFTSADARRVAALALEKELPVPKFQINRIPGDVSDEMRRFVGVWISTTGFLWSKRQFMVVVTDVDRTGSLVGFTVRGPPQAQSVIQSPPGSDAFRARIAGRTFTWGEAGREQVAVLNEQRQLTLTQSLLTGGSATVVLDPVWTLGEAERAARPR
jgi:DNA-binding winged helix-turn-helix (wHTH) protein